MLKKFIVDMLNQVDLIFNIQNGKKLDKSMEDEPIDLENLKDKLKKHNENYMKKVDDEHNAYIKESKELREKIKSMKNSIDEVLDLYNYCLECLNWKEMRKVDDNIKYFNMRISNLGGDGNNSKIEIFQNGIYQLLLIRHGDRVYSYNQDIELAVLKSFYNNFPKMKEMFIDIVNNILKFD